MRECIPTREESRALASDFALIPVYREVLADMLTPVLAYTLLCPPDSPGFLLESVEGGERLARYSFIGYQPRRLELGDGDPLPALRAVAAESTVPGIPRFHGGAVGYLGYETARHFERLPVAAGAPPPMPGLGIPSGRGPRDLRPRDSSPPPAHDPPAGPRRVRRRGRSHRRDGEAACCRGTASCRAWGGRRPLGGEHDSRPV